MLSQRHHQTTPRRPHRQGIILLLVLGMLALFSLLAATYVVFTSRSRVASESIGRRESRQVNDDALLQMSIQQVLSGPPLSAAADSALWGHDLLADYYGTDVLSSGVKVADASALPTGPYIFDYAVERLFGSGTSEQDAHYLKFSADIPGVTVDDALTGRSLTFTQAGCPLQGLTFPIIRHIAPIDSARRQHLLVIDLLEHRDREITIDSTTDSLRDWINSGNTGDPSSGYQRPYAALLYNKVGTRNIVWGDSGNMANAGAPGTDDVGWAFRINPRIRNGKGYGWANTGSGFNLNQDVLTAPPAQSGVIESVPVPVAFQGNHTLLGTGSLPSGDTDEPFDVADYHDWLLGYFPPNPAASDVGVPAPSGIRPAMLNYLLSQLLQKPGWSNPTDWTVQQKRAAVRILQRATLRPLPIKGSTDLTAGRYANFTGSNLAPASFLRRTIDLDQPGGDDVVAAWRLLITGPWDVDSDGDGVTDAVWMDLGLPVTTMPDGTLCRPMVALRIEDLDNRIDINTASSAFAASRPNWNQMPYNAATNVYPTTGGGTFLGFGYGPAEIPLVTIFRRNASSTNDALRLFLRERYGRDGLPGKSDPVTVTSVAEFDKLSRFRSFGRTDVHSVLRYNATTARPASRFGFLLDTHGRSIMSLDVYGSARYQRVMFSGLSVPWQTGLVNDDLNDPYEMNLYGSGGPDKPVTIAQLEPVLRFRDWDRDQLPDRLIHELQLELKLDQQTATNDQQIDERTLMAAVTAHSSTSALPSTSTPPEATNNGSKFDPMARLALKLEPTAVNVDALFPPELRRGGRMNLNRPFGNGKDGYLQTSDADNDGDADDLVVDDPGELTPGPVNPANPTGPKETLQPQAIISGTGWSTNAPNWPIADAFNVDFSNSRFLFARHLYSLMMLATAGNSNTSPLSDEQRARARRVAQWAINVVDFRDRDAIMTGFEYDENPFDGWDPAIDGNLATPMPKDGTGKIIGGGIVWGYEGHDLVLTETFAFHDRRVKDTPQGSGTRKQRSAAQTSDTDIDPHPEQYRIPQGSLFLELYNPRGPKAYRPMVDVNDRDSDMHQSAPPELYSLYSRKLLYPSDPVTTTDDQDLVPVLDLGRTAPDKNPVWRIGIGDFQAAADNPNTQMATLGPDTTFEPAYTDFDLSQPKSSFKFDRVIWLANVDPLDGDKSQNGNQPVPLPTDSDPERIYYNRFSATAYPGDTGPVIQGGQYAVVGPRQRTYVGSQVQPTGTPPPDGYVNNYAAKQRFDLRSTAFAVTVPADDGSGKTIATGLTPLPRTSIRSIVGVLAAANPPSSWIAAGNPHDRDAETAPDGIGVNVSEPVPGASYYSEPTDYLNAKPAEQDPRGLSGYPKDTWSTLPDEPFDSRPGNPLADAGMLGTGTYPSPTTSDLQKTAYLQRLADPTKPYDADANPYITVDWHPLDLTVFNGEDESEEIPAMSAAIGSPFWTDPDDEDPFADTPRFATRFKNGVDPTGASRFSQQHNVLWSYATREPDDSVMFPNPSADGYEVYFPYLIKHDGDWNTPPVPPAPPLNRAANSQTLGYLNFAFGQRTTIPSIHPEPYQNEMWAGAPAGNPFPWIAMLNRDFANPLELMLVPASSPDKLMLEFSTTQDATLNPYKQPDEKEFGHLLNFFWSSNDPAVINSTTEVEIPNLHRIFQLVETPDPFDSNHTLLKTERYAAVARVTDPPQPLSREQVLLGPYAPPLNLMANPGRRGQININTVNNPVVWRELMYAHSLDSERDATDVNARGAFWTEWMLSRRGFATPKGAIPNLNDDFPTQFAGHLGPAESAWIAPSLTGSGNVSRLRREGVNATLMRESPGGGDPVFVRSSVGDPVADTQRDRNALLRYQTLMRMKNLVSDNSNTFAVWVTLGYFETNVANTREVGKEYGYDAGQNTRKRAFFIIDRSVPVTYAPGEETDIQKTILLSRKLE